MSLNRASRIPDPQRGAVPVMRSPQQGDVPHIVVFGVVQLHHAAAPDGLETGGFRRSTPREDRGVANAHGRIAEIHGDRAAHPPGEIQRVLVRAAAFALGAEGVQMGTRMVSATFKVRVGLRSRERYGDRVRAL